MSWIAVAAGVGTAVAGGVQANQQRQRQKGIIGTAYGIAGKRQLIQQKDIRQETGESLGQRGLTQGGGVTDQGIAPLSTPSVGGAHTLGEQTNVDLTREQSLERQGLAADKSSAMSTINANANAAEVGAGIAGMNTGFGLYGSLHNNSFNGLDANNPWGSGGPPKGTIAPDTTNDQFNFNV